jgi:phosphoserine phosphatase
MSRSTFLVTVSGPDRIGVGADLFRALAALVDANVRLIDVAQITIRGTLVLCAEVSSEGELRRETVLEALRTRPIEGQGITVQVDAVTPTETIDGRRLLVTMLAPEIAASQLGGIFDAIASSDATCERIVHLARYPVECYELIVIAPDHARLRELLVNTAKELGLDLAVQRAGLHRRAKHLVVMDADSTLLQNEVIDLLGEASGRANEIAPITRAAMEGSIDFTEALRQRVALLRGLSLEVVDEVRAHLELAPGARTLIRTLQRLGYVPAVVSGGFIEVLAPLLAELNVHYVAANHLEVVDGRLTGNVSGPIIDRAGKARALRQFANEAGVPLEQTVAVGDGANDIDMLSLAGLGIAFNAKAVVQEHADTALSVPYLDAVLYFLGISREEIETE